MKRWSRLAPLTGVIYLVLVVVSVFGAPSTPDSDATGQHVISVFEAHRGSLAASAFLGAFAALFFLFFAAALRSHLRARSASDGLIALGFGGAVLFSAGLSTLMGLNFALADVPSKLDPGAAQALNVLTNDVFFPLLLGGGAFLIGNGLAIAASGALWRWFGWIAVVAGVVSVTPVGWIALLVGAVWAAVAGVVLFRSADRPVVPPRAAAAPAVERDTAVV